MKEPIRTILDQQVDHFGTVAAASAVWPRAGNWELN
jgi:hypothetical protein